MLNYSPENPPPKSRITNKRVAFPVGSSAHADGPSAALPNTPPMPPTSGCPCIESLYINASNNFNKSLELINDEFVKEQIWQMLSAWQNGKFSANIQKVLTDLSTNVVEKNMTGANEIHLRLAMPTEETSILQTYLPALKYLIKA